MKTLLKISVLLLALTSAARAQTWFTVLTAAQQSPNTTVTLPIGATYRVGDAVNNKWGAAITVTAQTTLIDYAAGGVNEPADPDPGTAKEFDVQELNGPQIVTINNLGAIAAVTVPALSAAPTPTPIPGGQGWVLNGLANLQMNWNLAGVANLISFTGTDANGNAWLCVVQYGTVGSTALQLNCITPVPGGP